MHAYLIVGSNTQTEVDKLLVTYSISPVNLMTLTPSPSHGIESIREIIHYLTLQPAGRDENRGIVIEDAHLMTEAAQNAFLKTLEEPPKDTIIILTAPREDLLLPTILSRCVLISTDSTPHEIDLEKEKEIFEKLTNAPIGERVQFIEDLGKEREKSLAFVSDQLAFIHSQLHPLDQISGAWPSGPEIRSIRNLADALLSAHHDLSHNINPKMVLFELLRHY